MTLLTGLDNLTRFDSLRGQNFELSQRLALRLQRLAFAIIAMYVFIFVVFCFVFSSYIPWERCLHVAERRLGINLPAHGVIRVR